MIKDEKLLFQENKLSFQLVLLFIILNTIITILVLKYMKVNVRVSIFVLYNIVLSLLSFLLAMKVKNYSLGWGSFSIIISISQFIRVLIRPEITNASVNQFIIILTILSAGFMMAGGIVAITKTKRRLHVLANKSE
jgi:small-conductance mechanosensitive channel